MHKTQTRGTVMGCSTCLIATVLVFDTAHHFSQTTWPETCLKLWFEALQKTTFVCGVCIFSLCLFGIASGTPFPPTMQKHVCCMFYVMYVD